MGADSKIQWTHHTFNPWWGCARVSPGCENCYAERDAKRWGTQWGVNAERRLFDDSKKWSEPLAWDRKAAKAGERHRVFCASMADVFEDRPELRAPRARLYRLIDQTPNLDWLLLTKRPERADYLWAKARYDAFLTDPKGAVYLSVWRSNVWFGVTVEDRKRAARIEELRKVPAAVRFLSCEPLLEDLGAINLDRVHWVIVGGESGPGARPFQADWARSIVEQCGAASVACFVKQMGEHVVDRNDRFDTCGDGEDPRDWPWERREPDDVEHDIHGFREEHQGALVRLRLLNRKGGDPIEWPPGLRVREFPMART